jgi:hypothetical protein
MKDMAFVDGSFPHRVITREFFQMEYPRVFCGWILHLLCCGECFLGNVVVEVVEVHVWAGRHKWQVNIVLVGKRSRSCKDSPLKYFDELDQSPKNAM